MTPVTKYWVCKMGPALAYEAMECLGGNGYVEESLAARLYRELPLNAIWEGPGNVMALDLLRVLQREPETVEIVLDDLSKAVSGDAHLKAHLARVQDLLHEPRLLDRRGRDLAEALGDAGGRHHPARACPAGGGRRVHRHAAIRRSAPDLRPEPDWADTRAIVDRAFRCDAGELRGLWTPARCSLCFTRSHRPVEPGSGVTNVCSRRSTVCPRIAVAASGLA